MNTGFVATWNHLAASWGNLIVDRAQAGGVVLLVVALAVAVMRRRASAHLLSWLWLLPLVPLVLPLDRVMPEVSSPAIQTRAILAWVAPSDWDRVPEAARIERELESRLTPADAVPREAVPLPLRRASDQSLAASSDPGVLVDRPSLLALAMLLWASVALSLAVRFAILQRHTSRDVAAHPSLTDHPACRMLARLRHTARVSVPVRLVVSETITSPATWGWRRPVIMLPRELVNQLHATQLRWVLLHELAHIRRGDLAVAMLQRLVTILWWFNPLVWLTNAAAERHRECACDDAARARCDTQTLHSCAQAFLEIVAGSSRPHKSTSALATLVNHRSLVRERLMRLLDADLPVSAGLTRRSAAVLLACAALSLTAARSQVPTQEDPGLATANEVPTVEIHRAVEWLCGAQQADGRWRVSRESGRIFNGMETETSTTAVAVLALMEAEARFRDVGGGLAIDRGIAWLTRQQTEDGGIGPRQGSWTYGHALGTLALCAGQRRDPRPTALERIARATDFTQRIQNPGRGWRYGCRDGDNDSKMTSLMILALLEARALGLDVSDQGIAWGFDWISSMTDPKTGRVGWLQRGGAPGRLYQTRHSHPAELSEEVTALATFAALAAGRDRTQPSSLRRSTNLVLAHPPQWSEGDGSIDYSYWYWGARLVASLEGKERDAWRASLLGALEQQARDGSSGGIWPLVDAWSLPGLEVYATATCLRTLCAIL